MTHPIREPARRRLGFACRGILWAGLLGLAAGCATAQDPVSQAAPPLEGVTWRLPAGEGPATQGPPALRFDAASRHVSGSGGCNRLAGAYAREGARLRIGPLAATRMACLDPAAGAAETRFLAALEATAGYRIESGALTLLDAGGATLMRLEAAPGG